MSFHQAIEHAFSEIETRRNARDGMLTFGIDYLDHAMLGIMKNDLILVGAASGGGKTQFCCNVAKANVALGKRVHYIALEAEYLEIEKRIKYQIFASKFFADPNRPKGIHINYQQWMMGDFLQSCQGYEAAAASEFMRDYSNLYVKYKADRFDVNDLVMSVIECARETDLIILDHVHYMDYEGDNENKSVKHIAQTARTLALEQGNPIILVSHMRKKDRHATELAPSQEEFHGTSDLYKIATKAITLGPGRMDRDGSIETFIRIVKNRHDGSVARYVANCPYSTRQGTYEKEYQLGDALQNKDSGFIQTSQSLYPTWAKYFVRKGSHSADYDETTTGIPQPTRRPRGFSISQRPGKGL